MKFEVIYSQWAAEDQVFTGGVHEVEKPTEKLLRLAAGAEAAGSIRILSASAEHRSKLRKHVQSQADGEKAYSAAQADGSWQEGNLLQFETDVASGAPTGGVGG